MSSFSQQEIKEMLKMFLDEGMENIDLLEEQLKKIEKDRSDKDALVEIYRIMHSFKGMAATIGLKELSDIFHELESLISEIQEEKITISKYLIDSLFDTLDLIEQILERVDENKEYNDLIKEISAIIQKIKKKTQGDDKELEKYRKMKKLFSEVGLKEINPKNIDFSDPKKKFYKVHIIFVPTIRLKLARLLVIFKYTQEIGMIAKTDPPLLEILDGNIEDSVSLYIQSDKDIDTIKEKILMSGEIQEITIEPIDKKAFEKEFRLEQRQEKAESDIMIDRSALGGSNVRVELEKLELILELLGELLVRNKQLEHHLRDINRPEINELLFQMQDYMFNLQDVILQMQLVPLSTIFRIFPRMVRKLAKAQNKKVKLIIHDHDIKVDRKMINDLSDMVNHILRNAVSHGIEPVNERKKKKKDEKGLIVINALVENNVLIIKITDDGRGIDPAHIAKVAIDKGIITPEQLNRMDMEQIINLIFLPQFSSASSVDKVSGRGLGLNIVKEKLEQLGGSITIQTDIDVGTTFTLYIPLLKSLIRVLLVRINNQVYSISLDDIYRLRTISLNEMFAEEDRIYIVDEDNDVKVPLYTIKGPFFPDEEYGMEESRYNVVYLRKGTVSLGLVVDEFLQETEIFVKNIEGIKSDIKGIMGAAILDDGSVSLIIDPFSLKK